MCCCACFVCKCGILVVFLCLFSIMLCIGCALRLSLLFDVLLLWFLLCGVLCEVYVYARCELCVYDVGEMCVCGYRCLVSVLRGGNGGVAGVFCEGVVVL